MLKGVIDSMQKFYGDSADVFYRKGNVYVDFPHEKRGKYFGGDNLNKMLEEVFSAKVVQELGNSIILLDGDEYIEFLFNQDSEGVKTLFNVVGTSLPLEGELVKLICKSYLDVHNRG